MKKGLGRAIFALALSSKSIDHCSEYQILGRGYSEWHANEGPCTFSGKGRAISFDRATVRFETLSSFDFGPKKGFCLAHLGQNLPSPPAPPRFLLGQISGTRSSPYTAWSLAIFNKSDAVQTSLFLLNRTRSITPLTPCVSDSPTRFLQHAVAPP